MALHVDVAAEGVRAPVARARLVALAHGVLLAEGVGDAMLSIALVSNREIARLNRRHLQHRGPTDVIAFGFAPRGSKGGVVGDVYVAPDMARDNAARFGVGIREELARLVVHGTLHVLGHDHPVDGARTASAMWRRQEQLLARLWTHRAR